MARSIVFGNDDYMGTDGVWYNSKQTISDLNNLKSGFCFLVENTINRPSNIQYGAVFAFSVLNEYFFQIAFSVYANELIAIRNKVKENGNWNPWKTLTPQ